MGTITFIEYAIIGIAVVFVGFALLISGFKRRY